MEKWNWYFGLIWSHEGDKDAYENPDHSPKSIRTRHSQNRGSNNTINLIKESRRCLFPCEFGSLKRQQYVNWNIYQKVGDKSRIRNKSDSKLFVKSSASFIVSTGCGWWYIIPKNKKEASQGALLGIYSIGSWLPVLMNATSKIAITMSGKEVNASIDTILYMTCVVA